MPASADAGKIMPATAIVAAATHPEMCPARQNIMFRPFPYFRFLLTMEAISSAVVITLEFIS
jgi:hypothetical protein